MLKGRFLHTSGHLIVLRRMTARSPTYKSEILAACARSTEYSAQAKKFSPPCSGDFGHSRIAQHFLRGEYTGCGQGRSRCRGNGACCGCSGLTLAECIFEI